MNAFVEKLRIYALEQGADLFGIARAADLDEYFTAPHRPKDLLPDVESIVVMALHIPDGSLEAQKNNITNYSYNMFGYAYLNRELDFVAYKVTKFLEKNYYQALPIPGRGSHYWEKKPGYGPFSFRHAAVAAGLGQFGWSGLVLTPEYGSRQRFIAILTDAKLPPSPPLEKNPCTKCFQCIKNCPAGAITNKKWEKTIGGRTVEYGVVRTELCSWVAKGMTTRAWPDAPFNPNVDVEKPEKVTKEELFKCLWEKRDARLRCSEHDEGNYGATLCGRCMIFCTAGDNAMKARLAKRKEKVSEHVL